MPWVNNGVVAGTGLASWNKFPNPGQYPATAVPGAIFSIGDHCTVSNWGTNEVVNVVRPIDNATLALGCMPGTSMLDIGALQAFEAPSGGIGYIDRFDDMSACGSNSIGTTLTAAQLQTLAISCGATQTSQSNMARISAGIYGENSPVNPHIVFDSTFRNYVQGASLFPITAPGGGTLTSGATSFCIGTQAGLDNSYITISNVMSATSSGLWFIYPNTLLEYAGISSTGTNTITAASFPAFYSTGCGTLALATTSGSLTYVNVQYQTPSVGTGVATATGNIAIQYTIPTTLAVPYESMGVMMQYREPNYPLYQVHPWTIGQACSVANGATNSFITMRNKAGTANGSVGPFSVSMGSNSNVWNTIGTTPFSGNLDQVIGFSNGGTNGLTVNYEAAGVFGTEVLSTPSISNTTLTGGCLGFTQQGPNGGTGNGYTQDMFLDDFTVYPTTLTQLQMETYTLSDNIQSGRKPQYLPGNGIIHTGSSTTEGNGNTSPNMYPSFLSQLLDAYTAINFYNVASGGGPGDELYNFPAYVAPLMPTYGNLLVDWWGEGNGLQNGETLAGISGATLNSNVWTFTTTTALGTNTTAGNAYPGVYVGGTPSSCLTTLTAQIGSFIDNTHFTVIGSPSSTGSCTSITAYQDTAASELAILQQQDSLVGTQCASSTLTTCGWVAVGSMTRAPFYNNYPNTPKPSTNPLAASGTQIGEYQTLHAWFLSNCGVNLRTGIGYSCPGFSYLKAYVDLPIAGGYTFGSDPYNNLTIQGPVVSGNTVTLNVPNDTLANNYLVANNYIVWSGMPTNLSIGVDTGAQTITACGTLAANSVTCTLSGLNSGMIAGSPVRIFNLNPWTHNCYTNPPSGPWNLDGQHFCPTLGYQAVATILQPILTNLLGN